MFDQLRSPVILGAAPAGLVLGALAWLVLGGDKPLLDRVQAVETAFTALDLHVRSGPRFAVDPASIAAASPLFASTGAGAAAPDAAVRVVGLARTAVRQAALLSINNGPAEWLGVGESKEGVIVQEVGADRVVLETPSGTRTVALGEALSPSSGSAPSAPALANPAVAPGGIRLPPPPASAPRVRTFGTPAQ